MTPEYTNRVDSAPAERAKCVWQVDQQPACMNCILQKEAERMGTIFQPRVALQRSGPDTWETFRVFGFKIKRWATEFEHMRQSISIFLFYFIFFLYLQPEARPFSTPAARIAACSVLLGKQQHQMLKGKEKRVFSDQNQSGANILLSSLYQ